MIQQQTFNVSSLALPPLARKGKHKLNLTLTTNSVHIVCLTYVEFKHGLKLQKSKGLERYSPEDCSKILNPCLDYANGRENSSIKNKTVNHFQIVV